MTEEIHPCPNPECDQCQVRAIGSELSRWAAMCSSCEYSSPSAETREEAIRLHNLIAPPRWVPVEEGLPEVDSHCETWAADGDYHHFMWLGRMGSGRLYWSDGTGPRFVDEPDDEQRITHWRLQWIPQPPKQVNHG